MATLTLGALCTGTTAAATEPPPTISVSSTRDLLDGQIVHVDGVGLTPGTDVAVLESRCHAYCTAFLTPYFTVPATGTITTDARVQRFLRDSYVAADRDPPIDCAWDGACSLNIIEADSESEDGYRAIATQAISFARVITPPLTITFDAPQPFPTVVDTVAHGAGIPPGAPVYLAQCSSMEGTGGCRAIDGLDLFVPAHADASGRVAFPVHLRRADTDRDCLAPGVACAVRMWIGSNATPASPVTVPIAFDPNSPLPPKPAIRVTPDHDLGVAPTVTVTGTNFRPGHTVWLQEYASTGYPGGGTFPTGDWDRSTVTATSGADGTFTTSMTLRRHLGNGSMYEPGLIDCASSTCLISANEEPLDPAAPVAVRFTDRPDDPVLSFRGVWATEGTGPDPTPVTAHAELDRPTDHPVRFRVMAPVNAIDVMLNLTEFEIPAGATGVAVPLGIRGDDLHENPVEIARYVPVTLSGARLDPEAADVPIVIIDDDPPPDLRIADTTVAEDRPNHQFNVFIHLSTRSELPVTARYRTVRGTARPGRDYVATHGTVPVGGAGVNGTDGYLVLTLIDDGRHERTEWFEVRLRAVVGAVPRDLVARVTITDDD